ncbi:MAG: hypothetical protein ACOY3D_02720 [Candidatus Omnitrophota bacterium]
MARYLQNSLLKLALLLSLVFMLALQIAAASISFSLNRYPVALKILLESSLGSEVSFTRVSYGLHQGLSFQDFTIKREGETLGSCKSLQFRIALLPLVKKRPWINRIIIRDGWLSVKAAMYKDFFLSGVSTNKPSFTPAWKRLSIVLKDVKVSLAREGEDDYLTLNSRITLLRENIFCSSELDFGTTAFKRMLSHSPFLSGLSKKTSLQLQLAFMGDDLLVNNIIVTNNDIKIGGAGIIYNLYTRPAADIRIITVPLNLRELINYQAKAVMSGLLNIAANLKSSETGVSLSAEVMMGKGAAYLPKQTVRVSNLFMQLNLKDNRLEIKDLTALINSQYPFSLHGYVTDFTRPRVNLVLESFKSNRAKYGLEDSALINLNLDGRLENLNLLGDVKLRCVLRKQYPHYLIQQAGELEINGLQLIPGKRINLSAKGLGLGFRKIVGLQTTLNQKLQLNNLSLNLYLDHQDRLAITLNAEAYGGEIEGFGRRSLGSARPNDFFLLKVRGLSAEAMPEVIPDNIRLSGELSGILHLLNADGWVLGGAFTVTNGSISRFTILDNIADFLKIKSLKNLNGVTLSADFILSGSGFNIRRINLNHPVAVLSSGLSMNQNQWVSGAVNLLLQRRVLEESDILRKLLSIAKEAGEQVEFEFRISGFPSAIRVELQESKFRDRLIEKLSGSLRARIENEINQTIAAFKKTHSP